MKKGLVFGVALLVLVLCSLPAHAAPRDSMAAAWDAIFAPAPGVSSQPRSQDLSTRSHHQLPVKTMCSATVNCVGGFQRTCSGSNECFSVDKCYASCDGTLTWCGNYSPCPV